MNALQANGSGAMFDGIARRYDLLNKILSLGLDRGWRRRAVATLSPRPGERFLDLATGTGDVVLEILRQQPGATVIGLDPSQAMLDRAELKLAGRAKLVPGDAQALPFPDGSFDGVTIAFGIRNVPDRGRALAEMARVLRPGGRAVILELAEPTNPFARFHVHHVVPLIGAVISGAAAYRYLASSIAAFPPRAQFAELMAQNGLRPERTDPLTLGVATSFLGRRP